MKKHFVNIKCPKCFCELKVKVSDGIFAYYSSSYRQSVITKCKKCKSALETSIVTTEWIYRGRDGS